MKGAAWLLLWSLSVVAIDGVVIARDDTHSESSSSPSVSSTIASDTATTTTIADVTASTSVTTASASFTAPTSLGPTSLGPTSSFTGETVVAHLQGDAETPNSATFDVVGRWQLRWQVGQGGNGVAATVKDNRGGGQGFFMGLEPGSGSIERDGGCSCTLELIPDGAGYDVQVVDVEG